MLASKGKPQWLKIRPPQNSERFGGIKETIKRYGLHTVCEEAHCPNISECWSGGTATFMVMGDTCTRACKFCAVKTGFPAQPLDIFEPIKLARAIAEWKLDYVVITSVDRDDLPDQGAGHFAACIREMRREIPEIIIEVLIPDFRGNSELLKKIAEAKPEVIAHNIETVERLQGRVRDPRANYKQSLSVLETVKKMNPSIYTKSGIMLGLGENDEEVMQSMKDLRSIGVDVFTIGQYLRPSSWHLAVSEYVSPEKFDYFKKIGEELGFLYVAAGPFIRSSYRAGEYFLKSVLERGRTAGIQ
ncbi:MAG: lipoyl synthase [Candidatus Aenigmarchaeota archaeon]|nr:lipoyl synthase [Candidatus Aenigmarchaeota archaeon]